MAGQVDIAGPPGSCKTRLYVKTLAHICDGAATCPGSIITPWKRTNLSRSVTERLN
jgi:Ni2+-binding GTPase involved in maturation of urease and hydrogenase